MREKRNGRYLLATKTTRGNVGPQRRGGASIKTSPSSGGASRRRVLASVRSQTKNLRTKGEDTGGPTGEGGRGPGAQSIQPLTYPGSVWALTRVSTPNEREGGGGKKIMQLVKKG